MGLDPSLAFVSGEIPNRRIALRGRLGVELVQSHRGSLVREFFFGGKLGALDNDLRLFVGSACESLPEFRISVQDNGVGRSSDRNSARSLNRLC